MIVLFACWVDNILTKYLMMRKTRSQTQKSQENIISAFNRTKQTSSVINGSVHNKEIPTASIQVSSPSPCYLEGRDFTVWIVKSFSNLILLTAQILVSKMFPSSLQPMPNNNIVSNSGSSNVCNDQLFRVSDSCLFPWIELIFRRQKICLRVNHWILEWGWKTDVNGIQLNLRKSRHLI